MLGKQDRHATLHHQFFCERHQLIALFGGHAGRRLVHQQQLRGIGHGHRQFNTLHVTIRQDVARPVCLCQHADLRQQAQGHLAFVGSRALPHGEQFASLRQQRHLNVFHNGQRSECLGYLECTAHAHAPDIARVAAHQLIATKPDGARIGLELAIDHVEGGGLARTIRADQGQQFSRSQIERNAVDRFHATKRFAQPGHSQQRQRGWVHALIPSTERTSAAGWPKTASRNARLRSANCFTKPAIPCGNSSTSSKIMPPSMARQ